MYTYVYIYVYIYTERQRHRVAYYWLTLLQRHERDISEILKGDIYICMQIHAYACIERKRQRNRARERKTPPATKSARLARFVKTKHVYICKCICMHT